MKKKITITKWDAAETLKDERDYAGYLAEAFEDGDPAMIRKAMANVARARNMSALARDMGISVRGLYKTLSEDGNPEFGTIQRFLNSIGVKMTIVPGARVSISETEAELMRMDA